MQKEKIGQIFNTLSLRPPDPALFTVAGKESCSRTPPPKPRQTQNSNPLPINEDQQLEEFNINDRFERGSFNSELLSLATKFEGTLTSLNNRINFHSLNRDGPIHSYCVFLELDEYEYIKCEAYRGLMRIKMDSLGTLFVAGMHYEFYSSLLLPVISMITKSHL